MNEQKTYYYYSCTAYLARAGQIHSQLSDVFESNNLDEAHGISLRKGKEHFPESEGYSNHQVLVGYFQIEIGD